MPAVVGVVLTVAGLAVSLVAQRSMGTSWRIGVDGDDRTPLVEHGLFRRVRNPFFTSTVLLAAGSALALPTPLTLAGLLAAAAGVSAQVVWLEEPSLRRTHGAVYERYQVRTGRFLPPLRPVPAGHSAATRSGASA